MSQLTFGIGPGNRLVVLFCGWRGRGKYIPLPSLGRRSHGGEAGGGSFFIKIGFCLKRVLYPS